MAGQLQLLSALGLGALSPDQLAPLGAPPLGAPPLGTPSPSLLQQLAALTKATQPGLYVVRTLAHICGNTYRKYQCHGI